MFSRVLKTLAGLLPWLLWLVCPWPWLLRIPPNRQLPADPIRLIGMFSQAIATWLPMGLRQRNGTTAQQR